MSRLRLVGFQRALVLTALVGATVISSVAAASAGSAPATAATVAAAPVAAIPSAEAPSATQPAREPSEYCATFRAAFAKNLGATEDEMVAAAKAAIGTAVDGAVADGKLTAAEAARIKARIAAADADGCSILAGKRGAVARAGLDVAKHAFEAAAEALDLESAELRAELRAGKTLQEVAAAHNVPYETVTTAVLAAVKVDLDPAVAAGHLTQARADRILDRIERRLAAGWPVRAVREGR